MNSETKGFMSDLIWILQDKYNDTFSADKEVKCQDPFDLGMRMAYYDVLDIIELQLKAFGYDVEDISPIVPELGKKLIR